MKNEQKKFKYALRKVRKNREQIVSDKLVTSYEGRDLTKFWNHIKSHDQQRDTAEAPSVNGVTTSEGICEMWRDYYASSFATTANENIPKFYKHDNLPGRCTSQQVEQCIKKLKKGKSLGLDGISAEALQTAGASACQLVCILFNACLAHSYIPDVILRVVIVPIIKKKGLDNTKVQNYRPIALATIISKVF